jgi:hypothetical protein
MTTLHLRKSIAPSPLRLGLPRVQRIWIIRGFFLITLALICFALASAARAVLPAPDGGYPGANTAEGSNALYSLTTGIANTANGFEALSSNTTGNYNTAIGDYALHFNTASDNTATGTRALYHNTTGQDNTANGFQALGFNATGSGNTATGSQSLYLNGSGHDNTANGSDALESNGTGNYNTATGSQSLTFNTTGSYNTANGYNALYSNRTINGVAGTSNTATGVQALYSNTTGNLNTANGVNALLNNTNGSRNTADGEAALAFNTTGGNNTANGYNALYFNTAGAGNTASGFQALYNNTGSFNIGLGNQAGYNLTAGNRNIDIGNGGVAGESNTIRIGNIQTATYIVGISGSTATGGAAVFVAANGKLGTVTSSRRFKKDIADMDAASEALLALRPVTFRYKPELDKAGIPQYGLVAEEVAEVNPDLVVRDENGEIYTVRYEAVNAMLLNEFLKEHRKNEEQEAIIARLQKQIEALSAGLQKVSAQVETSRPAPQIVENDPR